LEFAEVIWREFVPALFNPEERLLRPLSLNCATVFCLPIAPVWSFGPFVGEVAIADLLAPGETKDCVLPEFGAVCTPDCDPDDPIEREYDDDDREVLPMTAERLLPPLLDFDAATEGSMVTPRDGAGRPTERCGADSKFADPVPALAPDDLGTEKS
jgi:hypothetical protein